MILSTITVWTAIGLAIDARKHSGSETIDTFFTREHGVMYASVTAYAVFLLWMCRQHMQRAGQTKMSLKAIPHGWGVAVGAVFLAGLAGASDLAWHTAWGIEQNLNILFSPAHLAIMIALSVMPFGVIRAAWVSRDDLGADADALPGRPSVKQFLPIALAVGALMSVIPVFISFMPSIGALTTPLAPELVANGLGDLFVTTILAGVLLHTLAWFGPLLFIVRRWRVPVGTCTVAVALMGFCLHIQNNFQVPVLTLGLVVGGVVCDALLLGLRKVPDARMAFRVFAILGPAAFWGAYVLLSLTQKGSAVPLTREATSAAFLWPAILGAVMASIMLPPRAQPKTYLD